MRYPKFSNQKKQWFELRISRHRNSVCILVTTDVVVSVRGRCGLWPFRFAVVSFRGFSVAAVSVCGHYDLLPRNFMRCGVRYLTAKRILAQVCFTGTNMLSLSQHDFDVDGKISDTSSLWLVRIKKNPDISSVYMFHELWYTNRYRFKQNTNHRKRCTTIKLVGSVAQCILRCVQGHLLYVISCHSAYNKTLCDPSFATFWLKFFQYNDSYRVLI